MVESNNTDTKLDLPVIFERYHSGWESRNPDLIATLHSDDTVFHMHDGSEAIVGRDALRQHCVELFKQFHFTLERSRLLFGENFWIFEWLMTLELQDPSGNPFTAKIEALDVVTVNGVGEVTRKDVYINGEQKAAAFKQAGLA
ncbi:nuclear transport factor 2 family protein [Microbulbifer epialgicus]|uniref:Nuclear transport factor 2 family protein n=1 Tax=Microbulbifer epialgicus TaxID=393907 RepID=A0ABV4P6R9_9GAMM